MKKIIIICIIALMGSGAMAQFSSASLQAAGLTCAMCTKAINKSLEKLSFIQSVRPEIKSSSFTIQFKDGVDADFDAIRKAVEEAGFSVAKMSITGQFNKVAIQNDAHAQIGGKNFHFLKVDPQTLQGEKTLTLVDKDFTGAKEFKKFSSATKMSCVHTGKAANCCTREGITANARIYHVTI